MSGDRIALDTNVAIHVLNDVPEVVNWLAQSAQLFLPAPVIGELNFGARNSAKASENLAGLQRLVGRCGVLQVDAGTADV
jgi:tRNA(fMet)-specific endonuclease VapC